MSESDVRAEVAPVPFADQFGGGDSEEPPGKPKLKMPYDQLGNSKV